MLWQHSTITDFVCGRVILLYILFTSDKIESICAPQSYNNYYVNDDIGEYKRFEEIKEGSSWSQKIREIAEYRDKNLTNKDRNKFISICGKYKEVFSDQPGKTENFQCHLK